MILTIRKWQTNNDEKLWELVCEANALAPGNCTDDWVANAPALVPVMERILLLARQRDALSIYFYDMSQLFWLVQEVENYQVAFRLAEMFHRDYQDGLAEHATLYGKKLIVSMAARIVDFYSYFPQIDDDKMAQMLEIYRDCNRRYGCEYNDGDYSILMRVAILSDNRELAEEAALRMENVKYDKGFSYIFSYGYPMIGHYIMQDHPEEAETLIRRIEQKEIPLSYRWCYEEGFETTGRELRRWALICSLLLGKEKAFFLFFVSWEPLGREQIKVDFYRTDAALFDLLAGDCSCLELCLRLAWRDVRDERSGKTAPLLGVLIDLSWYCYFQILDRRGVHSVSLEPGEGAEYCRSGAESMERVKERQSGERQWPCLEVAAYFERQADQLGAQMDRSRKAFGYRRAKRCFEVCCLEKESL